MRIQPKNMHPDTPYLIKEYADYNIQSFIQIATNPQEHLDIIFKEHGTRHTATDLAVAVADHIKTWDKIKEDPMRIFDLDESFTNNLDETLAEFKENFDKYEINTHAQLEVLASQLQVSTTAKSILHAN